MCVLGLRSRLTILAVAMAGAAGCDVSVRVTNCMSMSGPSDLVAQAKLLRIDVYGPSTPCVGNHAPPTAGPPQVTQSFHPGDTITLDIPPGQHTLVLTTFADAAGTAVLGSACSFVDLQPGEKLCENLVLTPGPDM